jgi:hypothetical protein
MLGEYIDLLMLLSGLRYVFTDERVRLRVGGQLA